MKHSIITLPETTIDIDDFTVITLLTRIETGEDVDNEEFTLFVRKCQEMIRNLHQLVKSVPLPAPCMPALRQASSLQFPVPN